MSIATLRARLREVELTSNEYNFSENDVNSALASIQPDGSVSGVNYLTDPVTPTGHMKRIARAYWTPTHTKYQDPTTKSKLQDLITHFESIAIDASNWHDQYVKVPTNLSITLLLMDSGDAAGFTRVQIQGWNSKVYYYLDLLQFIASNSDDSANRMTFLISSIYKSIINDSDTHLTHDYNLFYDGVNYKSHVSDGINADNAYRYHSHTKCLLASYGNVFLNVISKLLPAAYQTQWQDLSSLDLYYTLFMEGVYWIQHKRVVDLFSLNRDIGKRGSLFIGQNLHLIQDWMDRIIPLNYRAADFQLIKDIALGNVPFDQIGIRYFWISNMVIRKTANSHIAISIPNKRQDVASESFNGNGKTHMWLHFGSYLMLTDGEELYEVQPCWIWSRIPGSTSLDYMPTFQGLLRPENFYSGAANNNQYGVVGYKHSWKEAVANKFYFLTPQGIFCMGNGVGSANVTHPLITTVQQNISDSIATVKRATETTLDAASITGADIDWVFNGKAGYFFPQNGNITVTNQNQTGKWSDVESSESSSDVTKKIFSIFFNHGTNVSDQTYQYGVVQDTTLLEMQSYVNPYTVLRNDAACQAVKYGDNVYGLVFYEGDHINLEAGVTVSVKEACVMLVVFPEGSRASANIYVTDPLAVLEYFEFDISLNLTHEYSVSGNFHSFFKVPTPKKDLICSCVELICV